MYGQLAFYRESQSIYHTFVQHGVILLAKRISGLCAGFIAFAVVTGVLVGSVKHEPEGIPKPLLPKFKAKIAQVKADRQFAQKIGQEIHPRAVVAEQHFEFGMLDPHTTATHTFVVENHGSAPLQLNVLETTCKCTAGTISNGDIFPGGGGKVTLTWNTGYEAQRYEQTARIQTNDPLRPTIDLTIAGEVKAELIVPGSVNFGSINPGESGRVEFPIYSQLWDEFVIEDVVSDLPGFTWDVRPIDLEDISMSDKNAKWAWSVAVSTTGGRRGNFSGSIDLTMSSPRTGEILRRTLSATGKVRAPINFYSPDIHAKTGLELGTLQNDVEHRFKLLVRLRGPIKPGIKVLDVQPPQITAELEPLGVDGEQYRLHVIVPKDCDPVIFNLDQKQGFVEVGDPNDPQYRNWFPLHGAVIEISDF